MVVERRQSHKVAQATETMAILRGGEPLETKLARIAQIAERNPKEQFTSLVHHLNEEMLLACHQELNRNKACGIDGMTKQQYEEDIDANIKDLHQRLKGMKYKPLAVRRAFIPKPGSKEKRPLGIPSYEDKIVQLAISKILAAIYEQDFLHVSYGFRPNRSCHDALKDLNRIIMTQKTNWVVDADITGFFDHVDHGWMIKCLEVRIKDQNLLRLIKRFLKAGYMEKGVMNPTDEGTPQGGIISPILANIYLHYVLDLWFEKVVKRQFKGTANMVRYADDFVCCFQHEGEAKRFYNWLQERLGKFNLSIAVGKSKIIRFGQFAARAAGGKPETFDFLGFTHYCSKSQNGKFRVKRKTSSKKYRAALQRVKAWLKANRNLHISKLVEALRIKLIGYYRYYGVTDNSVMLSKYWHEVTMLFFKWINRRSQRNSHTKEKFFNFIRLYPLPKPKVYVCIWE